MRNRSADKIKYIDACIGIEIGSSMQYKFVHQTSLCFIIHFIILAHKLYTKYINIVVHIQANK